MDGFLKGGFWAAAVISFEAREDLLDVSTISCEPKTRGDDHNKSFFAAFVKAIRAGAFDSWRKPAELFLDRAVEAWKGVAESLKL